MIALSKKKLGPNHITVVRSPHLNLPAFPPSVENRPTPICTIPHPPQRWLNMNSDANFVWIRNEGVVFISTCSTIAMDHCMYLRHTICVTGCLPHREHCLPSPIIIFTVFLCDCEMLFVRSANHSPDGAIAQHLLLAHSRYSRHRDRSSWTTNNKCLFQWMTWAIA